MTGKSIVPLLTLPIVWGCYYLAVNSAVAQLSIFSAGVAIRSIALVLLTVLMLCKGELRHLATVKPVLGRLLLIGVCGFMLDFTAFLGLMLCPAGMGTVLLKSDILMVNVMSMAIYKQRFTKTDWICTFAMLVGIVLVIGIDPGNIHFQNPGNLFFILSAFFVSVNAFLIKSVQTNKKFAVQDNVIAYYNNFITLVLFTIAALAQHSMGQLGSLARDAGLMLSVGTAGVGQTLIYILYYYNLRRFPIWIVKIVLLLMPIITTAISGLLFGETVTAMQIVGMIIVLGGACVVLLAQMKKALPAKAAS